MILKLYQTSEWSQSKKRCLREKVILSWLCFKLNYYNLNTNDEEFWMSDSNQCWVLLYKVTAACFKCIKMINRWKHYKFKKAIKCNQLYYFNKVTEKLHYLLHFKYDNLSFVTYSISKVTLPTLPISEEINASSLSLFVNVCCINSVRLEAVGNSPQLSRISVQHSTLLALFHRACLTEWR